MDRCCFKKKISFCLWNGELYIYTYIYILKKTKTRNKECIILFYSNVTEGESNRQGPHLICETRNKALISNDWFYSAPFCLFSEVACSYRSVKWRACLQFLMHSVKALFVDDSSSSVALICCSACPLLFCTFSLLCAMF